MGLRESIASSTTRAIEICLAHPNGFQKVAATLEPVGATVFGLVSLVLIRRTIVRARRDGHFSPATAARTRQLGWFVVLMTTAYPLAAAAGRGVVVSAAVREVSWTSQLAHPHISIALLVVGLGVITFGRILGRAASLQQEVDLTV